VLLAFVQRFAVSLAPPPPPAGWYADPSGRHELRYWSGAIWTEHVADASHQSVDPLAPRLLEANTTPDWIERRKWARWGTPANAIRGENQFQDAIKSIPGVVPDLIEDVRFEPVPVEFIREPDNPYDRYACTALVHGIQVGYLARECASILSPDVDAAGVVSWQVAGAVVGGSYGAANFGVHVWLDRRLSIGPAWLPSR